MLIGQLAHPLLKINAFPQQLCSGLITPLLLLIPGRIPAGEGRQQGQIRFSTTAEGWCLRWLKTLTGELEGFVG